MPAPLSTPTIAAWVLQTEIDLNLGETTPAQELLAWAVILLALAVGVYGLYRSHYHGLPNRLARAKADLRGARADTTTQSVYVPGDVAAQPDRVREIVASCLDEDPPDQPTLRGAAGSVRTQLYETWAPRWIALPPAARRVLGLGILVVVFGCVAVSTDVLLGLLETSEPQTQPGRWPVLMVTETLAAITTAAGWLSQVPGVNLVWELLVTVVVIVGSWLYTHWYVVAAALLAGGGALIWQERRLDDTEDLRWLRSLPRAGQVTRAIVVGMLSTWLITLVAIGIGRLVEDPNSVAVRYGAATGLAYAAVLLLGAIAILWVNRDRIAAIPRRSQQATPRQQTYLVVRAVTLVVATVLAPLVPVYVAVGLTKLPTLITAYVAASGGIQAVGAFVTILVCGALAYQARAAWGDVRSALKISAAQTGVRSVAAAQGLPVVVVAGTYALVAGLFKSILIGVVVAIVAGLVARQAVALLMRARYRAAVRDRGPTPAHRVVVEAAPLVTSDGDREWYVRVNGTTELLHPDREQVLADAAAVAGQLVDDGETPATISEWHAEDAFEYGVTDPDETKRKLFEDARRVIFGQLRRHKGTVPNDRLDDRLADIPDPIVQRRYDREEFGLGSITRGETYTTLEWDPYQRDVDRQRGGRQSLVTTTDLVDLGNAL